MLGTGGNIRACSKWWLGMVAFCVLASRASTQQFVVADISTASFPLVTMQLFSFDSQGNPSPLDPQRDRLVTERMGVVRQTTAAVACPPQWEPAPIAAIMALDWASELVRSQARALLQTWEATAPPQSTLGAVIFGGRPYIASDFTANAGQIAEILDRAEPLEVAVPHRALADTLLGAVVLAARSTRQWRCALVVTEHLFPSSQPPGIAELVRQTGVRLIVLTLGHRPPQWLRSLCAESGGIALGDVTAELLRCASDRCWRLLRGTGRALSRGKAAMIALGIAPASSMLRALGDRQRSATTFRRSNCPCSMSYRATATLARFLLV